MDFAQELNLPGIALLLDQEKAYDKIHPLYLEACLLRFGFPSVWISTVTTLFSGNLLSINANGFLTAACRRQERDLRQADPLSPLLFNIALEPILRAIQSSFLPAGFSYSLKTFYQSVFHVTVWKMAGILNGLMWSLAPWK